MYYNFVRCSECGTVYNTDGTTNNNLGCCPGCGLHHSGHYRVVNPVLKPSPLAAKPVKETEEMGRLKRITPNISTWCPFKDLPRTDIGCIHCPYFLQFNCNRFCTFDETKDRKEEKCVKEVVPPSSRR